MDQLEGFLRALASAEPVPGGGSVAALEAAMGAALLCMVCNLTVGKPKFSAVEEDARALRDESERLVLRGRELVQEDTAAYGEVSQVFVMPRGTDEEKSRRRHAMQEALKGAVGPPLETMRIASQIVSLAERVAAIGNPSTISDVGSAVQCAVAAFESARLNVEINLHSITDAARVTNLRAEVAAIEQPDPVAARVMSHVEAVIRGDAG